MIKCWEADYKKSPKEMDTCSQFKEGSLSFFVSDVMSIQTRNIDGAQRLGVWLEE